MHVVHIITRLIIGGAQENTLLTVEGQHNDFGDRVTLITGPAIGPEGSLMPRARSGGFDVVEVDELRRSIHPGKDWRAYRRLTALLRELRPDIVHTHSSKAGILGRAAAEKAGIPCVHTIHGASFHYGQNALLHQAYIAAEKWAARRTARFISVADAMTEAYVEAGIAARDRFTTIYSGFDVGPFIAAPRPPSDVRRELGIGEDEIVAGKIGRLFHLKGHEFLIAAAPSIVARNPKVRFLIVGDGILRDDYERRIAAAGLTDHFILTGLVPPERIAELIHAMDIVVHTSQWEGLARVLPQGLIAGKPVVSYDVGGAREVVIEDETGILLPRDAVGELAHAICRLAADPELRQRMGQTGRERFTDQFRHQTMTRRIREVYGEVVSGEW